MTRPAILAVLGVAAVVGAWLAAAHAVTVHEFPPFLPGATSTQIAGYSGPWIMVAGGAALLAAALIVLAGSGFRRARARLRPASRPGELRLEPQPADGPALPTPGRMAG